ncbi:HTH domain-containing protein [Vallitalea guaymasensis]|uniref:HTH domain-containing protein n=1 Tax=Vallitalea guaymasensis TaxID=1185412 RepID=UPI0023573744|nr:HTH domain-containing protein [Vallitalea guaymasensis]
MAYTFFELIDDVFEATKEPLSEKEIWDKAVELGLDIKVGSVGKTPWKTISARIYGSMRDNPYSKYGKIGKRPTRFQLKKYLQDQNDTVLLKRIEEKEEKQRSKIKKFNERDIHPLLVKYVNEDQHFKAYCKTIYHENSKTQKKGKNKWLHPDIVGAYFPFNDFNDLTIGVQKALETSAIKFYSFELKVYLDFSNLREYYFQAVSNSSWANEGYLVCLNIKDDIELISELQRLNSAFGIGVIELNSQDILQSDILFPAHDKTQLDWLTIDRLIDDNPEFKQFMIDIKEDSNIGKLKSKYDKVMTDEEIQKHINNKKINF